MKSNLSKDTFKKFWKWFEAILNSFEVEWTFQKKQLLELFFQGIFKIWKNVDFFFEKMEKFQIFISFDFDEFWSHDINFFPVKAETSYFSMVNSLCNMNQQIVAFKAPNYPRKVGNSIFVDRLENRRI